MQTLPVRENTTDWPRVGQRINQNSAAIAPKPLAIGDTTTETG